MDQILLFALIGLGAGVLYAGVGLGTVVVYRGTGVINFSMGAMGAWAAYVYDELRRTGDLVLPVVVIPERISLGDGAPFIAAAGLATLSAALLGLLAHVAVFRPLRGAPVLAKVAATVGMLMTLQALILIHFTATSRRVAPILPTEGISIAGQVVPRDRIWLTIVLLVVTAALWLLLRRTTLGLAIRGASESERSIALAGFAPGALAACTWTIGGAVVGFLAVLSAPTTILTPTQFTLAIVPALAAALIGRLTNLWTTVLAGLAIGIVQSVTQFGTTRTWWPDWGRNGAVDALPFLVVVAALVVVGRSVPARGAAAIGRLPEVERPPLRWGNVAVAGAVGIAMLVLTEGGYRFGVITSMIMAIIALSMVVLTGFIGQISLAQAAFAGTGGFLLSKLGHEWGVPFPIAPVLAALGASLLGILVGLPALRIRGPQLAVVTLALAVAIERFIFRNPAITTAQGNRIPAPELFGLDLSVRSGSDIARLPFGLMVLVVLLACCGLVAQIARGSIGRRFLAVRSNERAAAAAGIDVRAAKLTAFAIASFLAGLGGALLGYSRNQLSADSFTTLVGISLLAFAYLGGITSVSGAVVAGLFAPLGLSFVVFDRWFDLPLETYSLLGGVSLVLTAIFNPIGIAGTTAANIRRLRRDRRPPATPVSDLPPAPKPARVATAAGARRADGGRRGAVLDVEGLEVQFGGLRALDGIDLRVGPAEIVGLIGPNGAGKTTLIDALTDFVPSRGEVRFDGQPINRLTPHARSRRGLGRTWQSMELFQDLSVLENVQVAIEQVTVEHGLVGLLGRRQRGAEAAAREALEVVGLSAHAGCQPQELSLGQQKLLGVARALGPHPLLVLLDEPAAGLDTSESAAFGDRLRSIADSGTAVLLVDHDMGLVLDVCDRIVVLDFGRVIAEGTPAAIRSTPEVVAAYLGAASAPAGAAVETLVAT